MSSECEPGRRHRAQPRMGLPHTIQSQTAPASVGGLVAPDGRRLRDDARAFLEGWVSAARNWDASRFVVVNLGFLALQCEGPVRPLTADPAAVDAMIALVGRSGAALFTITWLGTSGWQRQRCASARGRPARG